MSERTWNTKDERAVQMFKSVNRLHHRVFDKLVSDFGVSHGNHMLLMYLSRAHEPPSQKTVADTFEVSPAAVAVALKKLEADGYVTRETDASDSRSNRILLTDKGQDLAKRTHRRFSQTDLKMFETLTEEEKDTFARCLEKMHDSLEQVLRSAEKGE